MMGKMKFGFVNDYGIFLHDTPHKDLFAKAKRNLSLGCVRVERPQAARANGCSAVTDAAGRRQRAERPDRQRRADLHQLSDRAPDGETIAFADDVYKLDGADRGGQAVATASAAKK